MRNHHYYLRHITAQIQMVSEYIRWPFPSEFLALMFCFIISFHSDHEDLEDYIPPPAVAMSGRESRGKSPVTPSYRKPPPYVSP